jgi:uncharacterized repeat protein (TIGR01451 family)
LEPHLRSKPRRGYVGCIGTQSSARLLRLYRSSDPTPNERPLDHYAASATAELRQRAFVAAIWQVPSGVSCLCRPSILNTVGQKWPSQAAKEGNGHSTDRLAAANADLAVTKTDSPDPASRGGMLTYSVVVTNQGPASATAVQLTDQLSTSVRFISVTPTVEVVPKRTVSSPVR